MPSKRGSLFVLSGPSGCGKSTVIRYLRQRGDFPIRLSVSATTRPKRDRETDGIDYYYWTHEQFEEGLKAGKFLESALVHGNYYGTLRREVDPYLDQGMGVILDIDVQGKNQVQKLHPDAVTIFLYASSPSIYEERLRKRRSESEASIQRRLANGVEELTHAGEYNYQILNDNLEDAVEAIHAILTKTFARNEHAG